jgi:hypothetical protein
VPCATMMVMATKPVERQHRAVAEMKAGQRSGKDQQRLAFEKHRDTADLGGLVAIFPEAAGFIVINSGAWNHQHRSDGENAEQGGEPEHRGKAELPSQQAGQTGAHHVAGVIERLIMSNLPVETGLTHDAERDA